MLQVILIRKQLKC